MLRDVQSEQQLHPLLVALDTVCVICEIRTEPSDNV
jgi:hypothetical protein